MVGKLAIFIEKHPPLGWRECKNILNDIPRNNVCFLADTFKGNQAQGRSNSKQYLTIAFSVKDAGNDSGSSREKRKHAEIFKYCRKVVFQLKFKYLSLIIC